MISSRRSAKRSHGKPSLGTQGVTFQPKEYLAFARVEGPEF